MTEYEEACKVYSDARTYLDDCWEEVWACLEKVREARKRAREAMDNAKTINERMNLR